MQTEYVAADVDNPETPLNEKILIQVTIAFVLTVFILIAITGNILVCIAIYTDRNLRHIGNVFTASLAIADLVVGVIVMPLALFNDLLGHWNLPQLMCGIWVSMDVMGTTASILNLCAISLDRYIHIKDPLHYNATVTAKLVIPAVVMLWILSTLISFVPMNLGWHEPFKPDGFHSSNNLSHLFVNDSSSRQEQLGSFISSTTVPVSAGRTLLLSSSSADFQCSLEINPVYAVTSSIISFYFPCIIMLIIYTRLYMEAQRHVKSVKEMAHVMYYNNCSSTVRNGGDGVSSNADANNSAQTRMISEHKAAITLGIIVSVFLICWAPFFAINIIHAYCRCISNITFKALTWLGYCNSAFNPIIYSIFNQDFRKAFRKLLQFRICFGRPSGLARGRTMSSGSAPRTPTSRSRISRTSNVL